MSTKWTPVCEWCEKPLVRIRGEGEDETGEYRAVGYCNACQTDAWSIPRPVVKTVCTKLPKEGRGS